MRTGLLRGLTDVAPGPELPKVPSGIAGLDAITGGGLPEGRVTLLAGGAGSGKTLIGLTFLVAGAREHDEPGVLLTFESSADKAAADVRSLGYNLEELENEGRMAVLSYRMDPSGVVTAGEFSLEPLFLSLAEAVERVHAKRVVLDTVEVLFGTFGDEAIVRSEFARMVQWLEVKGLTAIVTGERRGEATLTRWGIEEFVSDCVILLDHEVHGQISTRRLRVVKYRGSAHGTNEYPFLISADGITVLPITSIALDYPASRERISTGVDRLDHMLGGGLYRGSTVLVSGAAGTGKTTLGACLLNAACARGETGLWLLYEEAPDQVLRNMRSVGLDLEQWADAGLLHLWASRPSAFGVEGHLAVAAHLLDKVAPQVVVLDGLTSFLHAAPAGEVTALATRQFDLLKSRGVTVLATALAEEGETTRLDVSSIVDTWLLLRNVESNGERNRLLFVIKSRGSAHSNQVREFVMTDHGVELVDVYVGPQGVQTGSARVAQQAAERESATRAAEEREVRRRELRRSVVAEEAHIEALRAQIDAEKSELEQIDRGEHRQVATNEAGRRDMAARRWADAPPDGGGRSGGGRS